MSIIADIERLDGTIDSFEDFLEAINSVNSNETIILRDNVTVTSAIAITKKFTLDLNGFEITSSISSVPFVVDLNGDLTVKDSSEGQTGAIINNGGSGIYLRNTTTTSQKPTFTLESGTIQAVEFGICVYGGCRVNVKGGTIIAKDNGGVASNGSSQYAAFPYEINISGGNIFANTQTAGYANCGVYHANAGVVNISGGNIVATAGAGVVVRAGSLNVTGGTIEGQGDSSGQKMGDATPTYCGGVEICNAADYPGGMKTVVISGGQIISTYHSGVTVIGNPEDYAHAANSKAVILGGVVKGNESAVNYVTKEGEEIEDVSTSNLTIVGGDFNSDIRAYADPSVNVFIEYDEDGKAHYVIKDGMKAIISYLDEILDSGKESDEETISLITSVLQGLNTLLEKTDDTNADLSSIDSNVLTVISKIEEILDKSDLEISALEDLKTKADAISAAVSNIKTTSDDIKTSVDAIKDTTDTIKDTAADIKTASDAISTTEEAIKSTVDDVKVTAEGIKSTSDDIKTDVANIKDVADATNTAVGEVKTAVDEIVTSTDAIEASTDSIEDSVSDIKESSAAADSKLGDVLSTQERIATLQRSIAESVAKIAGDEIIDDDIRPKNPEEMEMLSFKKAIDNAERTGQTSILWHYKLSEQIEAVIAEKGYEVALVPSSRLGDIWEIKIK